MTYTEQGKRTSVENLAGQVTTTAWDCCHKVSETQPDGSTTTWDYDDEGNQTLVKTATGIWQIQYNGENRPILWERVFPNSSTPNSFTSTRISMSHDRMGRRVTKNAKRFVYDGYLQVAELSPDPILHSQFSILHSNVWDPTEPVATRPLVWNSSTFQPFNFSTSYYTHDGNRNVSEVVAPDGTLAAHYEYAPFGADTVQHGASAADTPWRFSSEFVVEDSVLKSDRESHRKWDASGKHTWRR